MPTQNETPEMAARRKEQQDAAANPGRQGLNVQKSQTPSGANFEISGKNNESYNAHGAALEGIAKAQNDRLAKGQSGLLSADELMAKNDATFGQANAITNEQASRGGVEVGDAVSNAGGIGGIFGGKEVVKHYTAGKSADTTTAANKALIDQRIAQAGTRPDVQAQAATLDQSQADQFRAGQTGLVGILGNAAAGNGPSAAQGQLSLATSQNMSNALALARSGKGNQSAAMKQAQLQQASMGQDAAAQSAMLKANEQQAAQAQLGNVLAGARGQDLGAASTNAGMAQQTNLANMQAQIEQQKQKDTLIQQYTAAGLSLDQAQRQAEIQQAQFNAELLARQAAADKGVAMQSSQAAGQTAGAVMSAIGTAAAALPSDKRAKKNIGDGDKSIERFLDSVAAKDWDYKDPAKHGEGRRTGIMAQDAEKNSDMVFTHTDGVKMLDLGKATSTSLAALANINKRLRQLEK